MTIADKPTCTSPEGRAALLPSAATHPPARPIVGVPPHRFAAVAHTGHIERQTISRCLNTYSCAACGCFTTIDSSD